MLISRLSWAIPKIHTLLISREARINPWAGLLIEVKKTKL